MRDIFFRAACGVLLGISVVAPGVSGTIIAVAMGIYDRLIGIISNPFNGFRKNIVYLLPMGAGGALGALGFLLVFKVLLDNFPVSGYMLFIGLVVGSAPVVTRELKAFKPGYALAGAASAAFVLAVSLMAGGAVPEGGHGLVWLSLCGAIAGAMSVIPGISVSMTLMILGVYSTLLDAVFKPDFAIIIAVGTCFLAGMILFSNVIKRVFTGFRSLAFYMVLGFLIGSVLGVLAGLPAEGLELVPSVAAVLLGVGLSWLSQRAGRGLTHREH